MSFVPYDILSQVAALRREDCPYCAAFSFPCAIHADAPCTGIAASWCPVHGDCTCPRTEGGEIEWHYESGLVSFAGHPAWSETAQTVIHYDKRCPLHGEDSEHAEGWTE